MENNKIITGVLLKMRKIILIGNAFFFSKKNIKKKDELYNDNSNNDNLLCRFVLDGSGNTIGESVAIDEDIIIIKNRSNYLGIPIKHIEKDEKTLLVKGLIDKDKAEEMGKIWEKKSLKFIKNE